MGCLMVRTRTPTGITGVTEASGCMTSEQANVGNRVLIDYK